MNGVIAEITPKGTFIVNPNAVLPPIHASSGTVSPYILLDSSADSKIVSTDLLISFTESFIGLPVSSVMRRASSLEFFKISS